MNRITLLTKLVDLLLFLPIYGVTWKAVMWAVQKRSHSTVRTLEINSLSKFQVYNTVLTVVIILYIRSPERIITES